MTLNTNIRDAVMSDMHHIQEIYRYYAEETTITFVETTPDLGYFSAMIPQSDDQNVFIVYEEDGIILGYAYTSYYRSSYGYRFTRELSIYTKHNMVAKGVGQALLDAMIDALSHLDVHLLISAITADNVPSLRFHLKNQFEEVGHLKEVGNKFDQWLDVKILQLKIGQENH